MSPHPKKILIIAVPAIGDVLLTSPLAHSLKNSWPNSEITLIVRKGAEVILENQECVDRAVSLERKPGFLKSFKFIISNLFKYDLAISTSSSDRAFIIAQFFGKSKVLLVPPKRLSSLWKYLFPGLKIVQNDLINVVDQNLKFIEKLGLEKITRVSSPSVPVNLIYSLTKKLTFDPRNDKFVVFHLTPAFSYKKWPLDSWKEIINFVLDNNFKVVLSCAPEEREVCYNQEVVDYFIAINSGYPIYSLAGKFNFTELSCLLSYAKLYLGPDTSTTHLAATLNIPVIALYGQSNILKWAPWSSSLVSNPIKDNEEGIRKYGQIRLFKGDCLCRKYSLLNSKSNSKAKQKDQRPSLSCMEQSLCMASIEKDNVLKEVKNILNLQSSPVQTCLSKN